jgi:hypothetical protein
MRVSPFLRRFIRGCVRHGGLWLVVGSIVSSGQEPIPVEKPRDDSASRLGFRFDRQAREAALAKAKAESDALFAEAPDSDVVRLPKYLVTEDPVLLEEHEVLTPKGKIAVAEKRYLAPMYKKTVGPLMAIASFLNNPLGGWSPNAPEAMAIYEDFEAKRRRNRISELTELAELADRAKIPKAGKSQGKSQNRKKR